MFTDHWNNQAITFLKPVLANSQSLIRIATGFFTVEGFNLIGEHLAKKRVELMVGYDELSKERLREKLIDDVMFHLSTWDGPNRRTAVIALVNQLKAGKIRVVEQRETEIIDARLRNKDHAKVFIIDDEFVVVGSGNLTYSGLRTNVEGLTLLKDSTQVKYWVDQFKHYWKHPNTVDLTQALLEALLKWLDLRLPYDIYLKTVQALIGNDSTPPPRDSYKMPVKYQMVVIERVLRQLKDWGGAMLVASTGLGKTVMATHIAYRLRLDHHIYNALVFAPLQVHPNWQRAMESAGIACQVLTRDLLDQPPNPKKTAVRALIQALERADDKYIIFVDESQHFKNMLRAKDGDKRHSFMHLYKAANERGAKIVLLTATPFAKDIADLNNQLYLLPHNAEPNYLTVKGQQAIPGILDEKIHPKAWKVYETEDFFRNFMDLPVCTVISTSQVAKDFAEQTPEGDFVLFGQSKRWIPQIEIKKIKVPVSFEREISKAIREGYFKHKLKRFKNRGVWQHSETTIEMHAEVAWTSSPLALREVIEKTLDGTYSEEWIRSFEIQEAVLKPILKKLQKMTYQDDEKFIALCKCLSDASAQERKIIIFTERHATAVYLEEGIKQEMPDLRVANASRRTDKGYELREFDNDVQLMIYAFAPEANKDAKLDVVVESSYDVFITTDAYSTGVNLEDASVVISYDLAWTPDTIIQRAGRVLRLWKDPRLVSLYVFVGEFQTDTQGRGATEGVEKRLRTLTTRSQYAQQFSELPVFPKEDIETYNSLAGLSKVTIEDLGLVDITKIEEFSGVSGYLRHITELKRNQKYSDEIPDDITSSMNYNGDDHLLYLLLRYKGSYFWMLYHVKSGKLDDVKEDRLLSLIQCTQETPIAESVDPGVIEQHAQKCRTLWLEKQSNIDPFFVERICALYLIPYKDAGDFGKMFQLKLADVGVKM